MLTAPGFGQGGDPVPRRKKRSWSNGGEGVQSACVTAGAVAACCWIQERQPTCRLPRAGQPLFGQGPLARKTNSVDSDSMAGRGKQSFLPAPSGMWQCLALLLLATVNAADFSVIASSSTTSQGVPLDVTLGAGQSTTVQAVTFPGVTFFGPGDPRNGVPVVAGLNMDQIAITGTLARGRYFATVELWRGDELVAELATPTAFNSPIRVPGGFDRFRVLIHEDYTGQARIPPVAGNLVPVQPLPATSFTANGIRTFFAATAFALLLVSPVPGSRIAGAAILGGLYRTKNQKRSDISVPVNTTDCYSGSNPSYTQHPAFQASAFVSVPGQANQSCLWVADIGGNLSYVNAPISANDIIVVEVEGRAVLALDENTPLTTPEWHPSGGIWDDVVNNTDLIMSPSHPTAVDCNAVHPTSSIL
eukprot:jgi/Astpho2/7728/Aster-02601